MVSIKLMDYFLVPPSEPRAVMVKSLGATWIFITWEPHAPNKVGYPTISYEVRINNSHIDAGPLLLTTGNYETFINVTGLLPDTTYELTVMAVSQVGDAIARSGINANFVVKRTEVTGELNLGPQLCIPNIIDTMSTDFTYTMQNL